MPQDLDSEGLHYDEEDLAYYFSGDMPDDDAVELEMHLGKCLSCRAQAKEISERSSVWISWTPEAHRQALVAEQASLPIPEIHTVHVPVAANEVTPPKFGNRLGLRPYLWPTAALGLAAAAGLLFWINIGLQDRFSHQSEQLVKANSEVRTAENRARSLEQEAEHLRQDLAAAATSQPSVRPANQSRDVPPLVAAIAPPLTIEQRTLGAGDANAQELSAPAQVSSVKIEINLPELRASAILDATITGAGPTIERKRLVVDRRATGVQAGFILNPAEVKLLLNRPVQVTVTERGHAALGSVMMTLRPR
jgi:anti-sigma factor RsiW